MNDPILNKTLLQTENYVGLKIQALKVFICRSWLQAKSEFTMKKLTIFLFLSLLVGFLVSWLVAGQLVSPVRMDVKLPETDIPVEEFSIASESGALIAGWHLDVRNGRGVVILFHGVRANRLSMFERATLLYENGFSVVLIDFQAHGESTGENITIGYLEKYDVLASIAYAKAHHVGQPVGIIGVSLGAAATILASPQNIDAIIIESTYPDIRSAVVNRVKAKLGFLHKIPSEILLFQLEPRLGFDVSELAPIDRIGTLNSPIFIISGSDDVHTTKDEAVQLFSRANEPKQLWIVKGVGHEDVYSKRPELYKNNVLDFLSAHMIKSI